ncbi:MAG: VOC family protein [Micropruina sp.]|nr:VOC family protein [Micropruina sp.]
MTAQLIVNLDRRLITSLKRRAIDSELSLSELVTRICSGYLGEWQDESPAADDVTSDGSLAPRPERQWGDEPELILQSIVHVADAPGAVALLEALGGEVVQGSTAGDWVQVEIGGAQLGLLAHPPAPELGESVVELSFEARTPLDEVESRVRAHGVAVAAPTTDQGFGRQLRLRTPDGFVVTINEIDAELVE